MVSKNMFSFVKKKKKNPQRYRRNGCIPSNKSDKKLKKPRNVLIEFKPVFYIYLWSKLFVFVNTNNFFLYNTDNMNFNNEKEINTILDANHCYGKPQLFLLINF